MLAYRKELIIRTRLLWYNLIKRRWVYYYVYPQLRYEWSLDNHDKPVPPHLWMMPGKLKYKDYLWGKQ